MGLNHENNEETEKGLVGKAQRIIDRGYSEEAYYDLENEEVLQEGSYVKLYAGEGDLLDGEVGTWWDRGLTASTEGLPNVSDMGDMFKINIKTGEIFVTQYKDSFVMTAEALLPGMMDLLQEALQDYDAEIAKALEGKFTFVVDWIKSE